jgi:hypothetical protein
MEFNVTLERNKDGARVSSQSMRFATAQHIYTTE